MPVNISRILLPTDFSTPARQAQKYAMALTERFGSELHLLHVLTPIPVPFPDSTVPWTIPEIDVAAQTDFAKRRLLEELGEEWAARHHIVESIEVGCAVDEIVGYAKQNGIDIIVIGTHGSTGFSRFLMGSVAERVVRLAECPVLTVHPKGHQFLD